MDSFNQRKKDILGKLDKSSIGGWDEKILGLCEKINKLDDYYTTSSCSGRVVVMEDVVKKGPGLFFYVSHDKISLNVLNEELGKIAGEDGKGIIKFKQEPMILHVACKDIESAKIFLDKVRDLGWKKVGIIAMGKNIIVEINGSEKMEFPIMQNGELLVKEEFLELVVKKSNDNLVRNWLKVEELRKNC
jgi:tRNA wybutosine-synthesizing protein 3